MRQIINNLALVLKYSLETILSGKVSIEVTRLVEFMLRNLSNIKFNELEIKWEDWQIEELTQLTLKIVTYSLRMGRAVNAWRITNKHDKINWIKASIELDQELEGKDHI